MKNFKKLSLTIVIALSSAFVAVWAYSQFWSDPQVVTVTQQPTLRYANLPSAPQGEAPDLTYAAENSVHAVVHVTVTSTQSSSDYYGNSPYGWFFGDRSPNQQPRVMQASGSGVIISSDGYIVTNNHVVDGADDIQIVLNDNREFDATLIGRDENTDIALLKIDATGLPTLKFGDSDALKLGEWVLAVGNPFNLTSTVTAGIVSAKSRDIGIIDTGNDMGLESFIQTDAAVNPGNSGGALVNLNGELVGINTAIASQTGSYSGYSFAIPSSIVQKVVNDLEEYGAVQRALLGVTITNINSQTIDQFNIGTDDTEGVYVASVSDGSGAQAAGLDEGDIILSVDDVPVNSVTELQEQVGKHNPGDVVKVLVKRDGQSKLYNVTLRNMQGNTDILAANDEEFLGAKFEDLSNTEKSRLRINHGIEISELNNGKLKDAGLEKGFIITSVNKQGVDTVNDLKEIVDAAEGGILIEGVYSNGRSEYVVISSEG